MTAMPEKQGPGGREVALVAGVLLFLLVLVVVLVAVGVRGLQQDREDEQAAEVAKAQAEAEQQAAAEAARVEAAQLRRQAEAEAAQAQAQRAKATQQALVELIQQEVAGPANLLRARQIRSSGQQELSFEAVGVPMVILQEVVGGMRQRLATAREQGHIPYEVQLEEPVLHADFEDAERYIRSARPSNDGGDRVLWKLTLRPAADVPLPEVVLFEALVQPPQEPVLDVVAMHERFWQAFDELVAPPVYLVNVEAQADDAREALTLCFAFGLDPRNESSQISRFSGDLRQALRNVEAPFTVADVRIDLNGQTLSRGGSEGLGGEDAFPLCQLTLKNPAYGPGLPETADFRRRLQRPRQQPPVANAPVVEALPSGASAIEAMHEVANRLLQNVTGAMRRGDAHYLILKRGNMAQGQVVRVVHNGQNFDITISEIQGDHFVMTCQGESLTVALP